jgi:hypothetical protein
MNDLSVFPSAGVTLNGLPGENSFDVVFRPAKPTLDAIVQMQPTMKWLERHRPGRPIDPEFLKVIPTEQELLQSKALFRQAEREPAPEAWTGIAVAMMVDSMPAAHRVNDAYVCAIIDGAYQDYEVWEGYLPGFSYGVIARSIREARRLDGLPTPGAFLEMCARHRRHFQQYRSDVVELWGVRHDAIYGPCPF